ncbi:hypothetical protein HAX54_042070, partial [Datura stramonium]|nr:hypothetical protein [Datura stramonium]
LLAIDEARLCLCVRRFEVGTGPSKRLVNRHAAALGCSHSKSLMCWVFVSIGLALALQRQHRQQRTASNAGHLALVFGMRCQSVCTYDA